MYSDCIELQSGEILALTNKKSCLQLMVSSSSSSSSSSHPTTFFDLEFQSFDDETHLTKRSLPLCPNEERALLKASHQSERLLIACDGIAVALHLPMKTQSSRRNDGKLECALVWESNECIADACWSPHNDEYAIILQREAIFIVKSPSCFSDESILRQVSTLYEKISLRPTIAEPRALSFFPQYSPTWSSMSASILYEDGSIYLVCPLLVPGALISAADYDQLLTIEEENVKNKVPSARHVPAQRINGTTLRLTWLKDFFKVSSNNPLEMIFTPTSTHEIFGTDIDNDALTDESQSRWSVCLQGPIQSIPHVSPLASEHQSKSIWSDIIARCAAIILPNTSSVSNFVILSVLRRDQVKTIMSVAPLAPSWSRRRHLSEDSSVLVAIPGVVMPQEDAREQCLDHLRMASIEGNPDWVLVDATSLPISLTSRSPFFIRDKYLDPLTDLFYIANDCAIYEVYQSWRRALVNAGRKEVDPNMSCSRILWERMESPNNSLCVCISSDLSGFFTVHEVFKSGAKVALSAQILQKRISKETNEKTLLDEKGEHLFVASSVKSIVVPLVNTLTNKVDYLEKLESMINCVRELRNKQLELFNRADFIKSEGDDYTAAYESLRVTLISLETKQETLIQRLRSTQDLHQNLLDRVQCITRLLKCSLTTDGSQIKEDLLSLRKTVFKTRGALADSMDSPELSVSRNDINIARQFSSVIGDDIASKAELELSQMLNKLKATLESSYRNRIYNLRLITDVETSASKIPLAIKREESRENYQLGRDRSPFSLGREPSPTLRPRARSRSASRKGRLSLSSQSASQVRDDALLPIEIRGEDALRDAFEVKRYVSDLAELVTRIKETA